MGLKLGIGTGSLMILDRESSEQIDLGEVSSLEMEVEEWSNREEQQKSIQGFTNPAIFSCENTTISQDLFDDLCKPSASATFIIEAETQILIQARWHKKARIRKKWLKRYGYKKDCVKTIMKAKYGEFNTETGECNIEIESIEYIFKPYQLQREVRK